MTATINQPPALWGVVHKSEEVLLKQTGKERGSIIRLFNQSGQTGCIRIVSIQYVVLPSGDSLISSLYPSTGADGTGTSSVTSCHVVPMAAVTVIGSGASAQRGNKGANRGSFATICRTTADSHDAGRTGVSRTLISVGRSALRRTVNRCANPGTL